MRRLAALATLASALTGGAAASETPVKASPMAMWRMDCGLFDIDDLGGKRVLMPVSCYLIRHGSELVLFDAGLEASLHGKPVRKEGQTLSLERTLAQQFADIGIDPAKVGTLVVSHYHGDHHGQADLFPNAKLLIGAGDAAAMRAEDDKGKLAPWLDGERAIEEVGADRKLREDGRLTVLFTPGHTPGHLSMLVKLRGGSYILTGDLVHQRGQIAERKPSGNHVDKERGKAEIERVVALAEREGAKIIVGHDGEDTGLLPAFPKAAE